MALVAAFDAACRRPPATPESAGSAPGPPPARPQKILILGGTHFIGPHIVDAARAHGHTLTLFNRGKTNPGLFPDIEQIHGDRNGDLAGLRGRRWDAVIDTSGQLPRQVDRSATLLAGACERYVFVSTISVYKDGLPAGADETAPLATLDGPDDDRFSVETYGAHKAMCEAAAERAMPGRVAIVRPHVIAGPGDDSDRFTYWPVRVARGGTMLAPDAPEDPVQYVDVRDLATWLVRVVEERTTGIYNAVGPRDPLTFGQLLEACAVAAGVRPELRWMSAEALANAKVEPWSDLPLWLPPKGDMAGAARLSNRRAVARGFTTRPVVDTARDTLAWFRGLPPERQQKLHAGLTSEREAEVLAAR